MALRLVSLPMGDLTATATFGLAGVTLALVGATIWLVLATRAATREAREQARGELKLLREQLEYSQRPVVAPTALLPPGHEFKVGDRKRTVPPNEIVITLKNIGVGPAMNTHVTLLVANSVRADSGVPVQGPGDERRAEKLPDPGADARDGKQELKVQVTYDDVARKSYRTIARWDGAEWTEIATCPVAQPRA
jgi:hypothetical protein